MSTGCALDENWVNIVVKNSPLFLLGVSNHQPQSLIQTQIKKHQSSSSPPFMQGIHRGPVNSPHKWPVTRKMFPFDEVIMRKRAQGECNVIRCHVFITYMQISFAHSYRASDSFRTPRHVVSEHWVGPFVMVRMNNLKMNTYWAEISQIWGWHLRMRV